MKKTGFKENLHKGWISALSVVFIFMLTVEAHAQPTLAKTFTPSTIGPGSVSTITFTIANLHNFPVTGISFTDVLPGAVTIADPANAQTDCDLGGTGSLSAPDGGTSITLSDARITSLQSCTVNVDVTASSTGTHTNPAITLSSSAGSSTSTATDLTVVSNRPGFSKAFAPGSVPMGGRSTLTFTVDNSANALNAETLDFTDNLPTGMVIASPANASTTCGTAAFPAVITAVPGTTVIDFLANGNAANPAVAAGTSCTVSVDVIAAAAGELDNISGELVVVSNSCGKASATLESTTPPILLTKAFIDDPVVPGGSATLEFTITNFDRNFSATGLAFSDDLTTLVPALPGLQFASLLLNDCGGSVSGAGGTTIGFTGGSLAPEGSCSIRVSLDVPGGDVAGLYLNTTSTVTGTVDGSPVVGNQAFDILFIDAAPIFTKEFIDDPATGGGTVTLRFTITNTDPVSPLTNIAFTDDIGGSSDTRSGALAGLAANGLIAANGLDPEPLVDPCGAGSSLSITDPNDTLPSPPFPNLPPDPTMLVFSGGSLAAAGSPGDSCTFDVVLDIPEGVPSVAYLNTTSLLAATPRGTNAASDALNIAAAPPLTKAFTDDPVAPGGTVTLSFTLSHPAEASGDASDITFTDDLDAMLTGLTLNLPPTPDPPCGAGSSLTASGNELTLQDGFLQPGQDCTFSLTLDVPAGAAPGTYTNTTSDVSATVSGLAVTAGSASDTLNVAGLRFAKEFIGDPAIPGETITLRFTIENIHPTEGASGIAFTDNLNAALTDLAATGGPSVDTCGGSLSGTTLLSYSGGSVASGSTCTIDVPVLVPTASDDGTYRNATSSLSATQGGAITIEPAVDNLEVNATRLQVVKSFTDDPVGQGDSVTIEFTLTNLDAARAASNVDFTDNLAALLPDTLDLTFDSVLLNDCGATVSGTGTSMITVTGASLAAGGSCTIRTSLSVPGNAVPGTYINTTSSLTGTMNGLGVTGDPASDSLEVLNLLTFSKSFDGPTTPGGTALLTFTITNPGPVAASGVQFTDDLNSVIPGLVATNLPLSDTDACGAGSIVSGTSLITLSNGTVSPSGGTCSFDVEVLVPASATPGTYANTTSALFESGIPVSEPATSDLTVEPPPGFAKAFSPDIIGVTGTTTLTFAVDNTANSLAATGLTFSDPFPSGLQVADPPNQSTTCSGATFTPAAGDTSISFSGGTAAAGSSCTVKVDVTGPTAGAYNNTSGDLTSSHGNSGPASDTLTVTQAPAFSKVFAPDSILSGGTSVLTFTIDNSANVQPVTGLTFSDTFPGDMVVADTPNASSTCSGVSFSPNAGDSSLSFSGGTLAAGASCTVQVTVTSSTAGENNNISGDLTSSLGNSGTASDTLTVNQAPAFSKTFTPSFIHPGEASTLVFTIDNSVNNQSVTGLTFSDTFPGGMVVADPANASSTCSGASFSPSAGDSSISFSGGTLAAGASCTVQVNVTGSALGTYNNTSGDLTSSFGNSGTASDTLTATQAPGFSKTFVPDSILSGGTSVLTFTIDNSINVEPVTGLTFSDTFPGDMVVADTPNASSTCSGASFSPSAGDSSVSFSGGTLAAGASCTVQVTVTSSTAGGHNNISGNLTSSLGNSGTASDTLIVSQAPGFSKSFAPTDIVPNGTSVLTFTIDNSANVQAASGLTFSDIFPAGLVVADPPNASSTCSGASFSPNAGDSSLSFSGGTLAAGASCTVQVAVTGDVSGDYTNTSGHLTSSLGTSSTATDTLTIVPPPPFSKRFEPISILPGQIATLIFTIDNTNSALPAGGIGFTDTLPNHMFVAAPPNASTDCTGGTITALAGSNEITFTNGEVAAETSCTVRADIIIYVEGVYTNTTEVLNSSLGQSPPAIAVLDTSMALIPTLNQWSYLLLLCLLAFIGIRQIQKTRRNRN